MRARTGAQAGERGPTGGPGRVAAGGSLFPEKSFLHIILECPIDGGAILVRITKEMVLAMHEDLINAGGLVHGVLSEGTLDYMIAEINFVPGVYAKAARALYMSRYHPFFDGNKRTAFVLAATILRISGHYLGRSDEDKILDALQKISNSERECEIERIEAWIQKKSRIWFKARQKCIHDYL